MLNIQESRIFEGRVTEGEAQIFYRGSEVYPQNIFEFLGRSYGISSILRVVFYSTFEHSEVEKRLYIWVTCTLHNNSVNSFCLGKTNEN